MQAAQNALKAVKYDTEQARAELTRNRERAAEAGRVAPAPARVAPPVVAPQGGSNLARTLEEMQADALAEQIRRSMKPDPNSQ